MSSSGSGSGVGLTLALWTAVSGMVTIKGVTVYAKILADMFETISGALSQIGR